MYVICYPSESDQLDFRTPYILRMEQGLNCVQTARSIVREVRKILA